MFRSLIFIVLFAFCLPLVLVAEENKTRVFPIKTTDLELYLNEPKSRLKWMVTPSFNEKKLNKLFKSILEKKGIELTKSQTSTAVLFDVLSTAECTLSSTSHDKFIADLVNVVDEYYPGIKNGIISGFDESETYLSSLTYVQISIIKDACTEENLTPNTMLNSLNISADEYQKYLDEYNSNISVLGYREVSKEAFVDLNALDMNEGTLYLTDFDSAVEAGILLASPIRLQGGDLGELGFERAGSLTEDGYTALSGLYLSKDYGVIRFTQENISSQETLYLGDVMNYNFLETEAILSVQKEKSVDNYFSVIRWIHPENDTIEYTFSLNKNLNDDNSKELQRYLEQLYSESSYHEVGISASNIAPRDLLSGQSLNLCSKPATFRQ